MGEGQGVTTGLQYVFNCSCFGTVGLVQKVGLEPGSCTSQVFGKVTLPGRLETVLLWLFVGLVEKIQEQDGVGRVADDDATRLEALLVYTV